MAALSLAAAMLSVSCHSGSTRAIDPALAALVPPSATILAGANLDRLRASPLWQRLAFPALALIQPLQGAKSLLVASDGTDYLAVSHGSLKQPPPDAKMLAGDLAAAGSPAWLHAAETQHRMGAGAPSALLELAEPLAGADEIWMVTAGNAHLPVSGNGENLNRLLHVTRYATWSVRLTSNVEIEVAGVCDAADTAKHLEETTRAMVTFAAAATARQAELSKLLKRIQVRRDDRIVHVSLTADPAEVDQLLKLF